MKNTKQIEERELTEVDVLANDLNQHCADLAETFCGSINCLACLTHALTAKGYRKDTDVAREIFDGLEHLARQKSSPITIAALFETQQYKEFKNKYMGDSNEIGTEN